MKDRTYALILNYNSSADSIELFKLLQSFQFPYLFLLILDNGSIPEDIQNLKQNIPAKNLVLNNYNLGYAGGNNIGIKLAIEDQAKYIWVLNPDIRVRKNTLPLLLDTLQVEKKIAAVGPRIVLRENQDIIFSDGGKIDLNYKCRTFHKSYLCPAQRIKRGQDYNVDYLDGSCILFNTEAIKECGFLPEHYFLYFEETDWCLKAKQSGWTIAVNSYATACNNISVKGKKYYFYYSRNKVLLAIKYHPFPFYAKIYYLWILMYELVLHISGHTKKWYWKSRFKGYWKAILS